MWNKFDVYSKPENLRDPALLISLSTSNPQYQLLYSQARELGKFLLATLDFRRIASLYSSALPPEVRVSADGIADLVSNDFYLYEGKTRDYLLFAGHSSPIGDEHEYADIVLSFAKSLGARELVSFGARWVTEVISPVASPKVFGFSTDKAGIDRLEESGSEILREENAHFFANTIVAISKFYDIRGYKLSVDHGEPSPHPKSLIAFLGVLQKLIGLDVDTEKLVEKSRQLADAISKAEIESNYSELAEGKGLDSRDFYR